jgi:hypothetical protein
MGFFWLWRKEGEGTFYYFIYFGREGGTRTVDREIGPGLLCYGPA